MQTNDSPRGASASSAPQPAVNFLQMEKAVHRDPLIIMDELVAAKAKFKEQEPKVRDYTAARKRAEIRVDALKAEWAKQNPDEPFDPSFAVPPAIVPSLDSPIQREFHRQHYIINRLEAELEAAKKAEVGN